MSRRVPQIAPLLQFIPELSPRYTSPRHLEPYTRRLERARIEPLRLCVSFPPRFTKTETTLHGLAWHLAQDPSLQIVYASYAQRIGEKKSRKLRELARRAGVPIAEDASSRSDWRTGVEDGGVWATGIEGALTGEGADILVIDDPIKDRATAESSLQRQAIYEWLNEVALTRLERDGSAIVIQTRWHEDDPVGRLVAQGWEYINLPAIDESGASLCPERFTAEQLGRIREQIGEYSWWSLYMGQPRPRGGQLFGDVVSYDALPERFTVTIGVDLAYSEKTSADHSVALVLAHADGRSYVLDVVRVQELAPAFMGRLGGLRRTHPGAVWRAYLAGTEKGVADVARSLGVDLGAMPPIGDKFVRAQPVAAAWNAGRVLLPKAAHWLNAFVEEIKSFTGVKDRRDDQVDALAAAYDAGHDDEGALPEWCSPGFMANAAAAFGGSADIASTLGRKASMPFPGSAPRGPTLTARRHQDGSVELIGSENEWPARFSAHLISGQDAKFTLECQRHGSEVFDRFRAAVQQWCNQNQNRR